MAGVVSALLLVPALALALDVPPGNSSASLSFLLVGDWGGGSDHDPTTHGEVDCAVGMGKVAEALNAQFVLGLGDNIYDTGVHSWNEGRLKSTFEDVYTAKSLQVDWWMVAGNHDHGGDIQHEIDFTKKSSRWKFPSDYYTFQKKLPSGKVAEFVMYDSVKMSGMSFYDEENDIFVPAAGPEDHTAAEDQWSWLEEQLAQSKADYLFVAAHYPVWSVCSHGPTGSLVSRLDPMLMKYNVTAYLAGHDHCLMHIEQQGVQHVLSGAGAKAWYDASNIGKIGSAQLHWHMAKDNKAEYSAGFAAISLSDESATVQYYGNDGALLFTSKPKPPRQHSKRSAGETLIAV